jgi:bZIP factor
MDSATPSTNGDKDNAYWERRRKNNEAAKRSRDARRAKEQEIALRAQFLEQENIQLKLEVAHLRAENAQLRGQFQQHLHLSAAGKN